MSFQNHPLTHTWSLLVCSVASMGLVVSECNGPQHWAFRKRVQPTVPEVERVERVRTSIDALVLAKLAAKGLTFSRDANRVTLVRRAYLDLIGLPPSPEEVDAYLADDAPDAYERLLDRLLASPHYGERWARHWLDVVGYVDTVGFDIDLPNVLLGEGKWRYRDYCVRSFNQDKPFDLFVTEQLAGDELVDWRGSAKFTPEILELLIATGFLRTAEDDTHEPESNIPSVHYAVLHDTVEIVGSSLLGLTLNCARCHDHKFDPIPQEDYYRLMAIFTPAYNPQAWKPVFPWKPEIQDRALPDVSAAERAEIERGNSEIAARVAELEKQVTELQRPHRARLFEAKLADVPEPIRADTKAAIETPADKRNEIQKYLAGKFEPGLSVKSEEVTAALNDSDKSAAGKINDQIAAVNAQRRSFGKIQAIYDVGPPPPTHLLVRGNHETPGPEVKPGFLSALSAPSPKEGSELGPPPPSTLLIVEEAPSGSTSGRRTALARWLTTPDSRAAGLLARVMVNRIWQHLFGEGIVPTPDNFGRAGEPPTHPELLDWLSTEFIESGWRVKPLIKVMMCSTAYRQAATTSSVPTAIDPGNQLLWRQRLRRLDSEVIRDAILATSGKLDCTMGGPPVPQEARPDGMVVVSDKGDPGPTAKYRRSVYLVARRKYPVTMLRVFDQPTIATNCTRRDTSAVPLQSLTMLNDAFVLEQAEYFAGRVAQMAGSSRERQIEMAVRLALVRTASLVETQWMSEHLEKQTELYRAANLPSDQAAHKALVNLCHTLLNTSEFLYAEGGQP